MTKILTMDKELFDGQWLGLRQTPGGYEYVTQTRMGREAVAVLGYAGSHVLGRFEVCPAHGDLNPQLCALTGGIEDGEGPQEAAMRELYEESGFVVPPYGIRRLGDIVRPSKASDTIIHLFAVPVPTKTLEGRFYGPGDGTEGEDGAWCEFVAYDRALMSKDPLLATMAARRVL